MAAINEIADKDRYEELTEKQQTGVDLLAENPDTSLYDLAEGVDIDRTYLGTIRKKYADIIEDRRNRDDELREFEETTEEPGKESDANGRVKTEFPNGSFEGQPIDATMQYITERNYDPDDVSANVEDEILTISIDIERTEARTLLTNDETPALIRENVTDALMEAAFE